MAPHDDHGRWFCIVYALIGIPLMTTHLAVINLFFMQGINKLDKSFKRLYKLCSCGNENKNSRILAKIAIISLVFIIFLIFHFAIFFMIQHARDPDSVTSFMNSTYFAVTTYGTIGFGDVTPQSMDFTQAMEVIRVLMFASTGLALVGLCFTLYREAADSNMKVITKKMSVLPQRISSVQRDFIDTLQRSRSLRAASATARAGTGTGGVAGTGLTQKKVWGRVSIQAVIESGRGENDTIKEDEEMTPSVVGYQRGPNNRASLWSRVKARDVVTRGALSRTGSSSRSSTVSGKSLQDILESLSRRASKSSANNDKSQGSPTTSSTDHNNCIRGADGDVRKNQTRKTEAASKKKSSACSSASATHCNAGDNNCSPDARSDENSAICKGDNDSKNSFTITASNTSLNSGNDQNISTLTQIENEVSQAIAQIQTDDQPSNGTDINETPRDVAKTDTCTVKVPKGCSAGR